MAININDVSYDVKPGYSTTRHLNTTLNTALVIIPQVVEFSVEPMDEATLDSTYYYVSTIRRRISAFTPTRIWNYEIGLVSPTIKLQRIVLPNRGITQRFRGTKLSIYEVLQHYVAVYASWATLSNDLKLKTENVTCPEFQWTQPTLFEVFNDLLKVVNCVVSMPTYTQISVLDLAERGSEVDVTKLNNMEVFQTVEEYASKLEIDAKNAVYPETNVQTYEWLVLKTTKSNLMTVENSELILAKNIYTIDKLEVTFFDNVRYTADITEYIANKTVYDSYKSSNTLDVISDKDYKRNALWYEEGSNIIGGFGYNEEGLLGINTRPAINNIITDKLGLSPIALNSSQVFEYGFRVWYTSSEDVKFRVDSDKKNSTVMINNQETSHTDLRALARSNQDTVNRIGQPLATIYARDYTPNIGDTMGDYVLTSITEVNYVDHTEMTAELTENYVMENMFTAIKNRKRYQQYENQREAFLSEHITEYNVYVTTTSGINYSDFEMFLTNLARADYQLRAVVANVLYDAEDTREFILNHSAHWLGTDAIRVNVKMDDNFSAGIGLERETVFLVSSRYSAVHTPYVDANGEFNAIELLLYKDFNNPNFASSEPLTGTNSYEALERARQYPLITDGLLLGELDIVFDTNPMWRYKDNREITSETLQFYFRPDDHVILGDLFYRHSSLLYQGDTDVSLYVYYSTSTTYEDGDQEVIGTQLSGVVRSANGLRSTLSQTDWDLLGVVSWGIGDADGNLYVGINSDARIVYIRSAYKANDVVYYINNVEMTSTLTMDYTKGLDASITDNEITSSLSAVITYGNDYHLTDAEMSSSVSNSYTGGDDVQISNIEIVASLSETMSAGYDPAITDVEVVSSMSHTMIGIAPDDYSISDVEMSSVISSAYTYISALNEVISDVEISSLITKTYIAGNDDLISTAEMTSDVTHTYSYTSPLDELIANAEITASLVREMTYYGWATGGTVPVGGTNCYNDTHLGDVMCDVVGTACTWVEDSTYLASTNETTEPPTCEAGASYTSCILGGGGNWFCTVYRPETSNVYGNCKTCSIITE